LLGRPGSLFRATDDGRYLIPDQLSNRVHVYTPDGRLSATFGRAGSGPGEFHRIGYVTLLHDSVLLQTTLGREMHFFRLKDGSPLFVRRHRGYLTSAVIDGDLVFLGAFPLDSGGSVAVEPVSSFFGPESAERAPPLSATNVPVPEAYARYPGMDAFAAVFLAVTDTTVLVAFGGLNELHVYDRRFNALFTVDIPRRLRRGVTPDGLAKVVREARRPLGDVFDGISTTQGLWVMPDGRVVIWHGDLNPERRAGRVQQVAGVAYLTLVSADLERACVDARLEALGTGKARVTVHRDTVLSLDQVPDAANNRASTVVRKYVLDDHGCRWLPTARKPMSAGRA
jgi:hypothetical protein